MAAWMCAFILLSACQEITHFTVPYLVLAPILDSLFVGDVALRRSVTYYDGAGGSRTPASSEISWASSDTAILAVDPATGRINARRRGLAFVIATVQSANGSALVAVSNALDLTLLLDTVYVMSGDTLTVPVAVKKMLPPPPNVWYAVATPSTVYNIDSASGRLTALAPGGPVPYVVHADTIADTGAVYVLNPTDTTGGRFFFSVLGTVVAHVGGSIRGMNYRRTDGSLAFQLTGTHPSGVSLQTIQIVSPNALATPGTLAIDSLSPGEAGTLLPSAPPYCAPPRPWALWSSATPSILALSRSGTIGITQIIAVTNGQAISGRFTYLARRTDLYSDTLGVLAIRGSFVGPLVTDRTTCP